MYRTLTCLIFLLFLCLVAAPVAAAEEVEENIPTNILFISIDDLRPDIGAAGVEHVITPNLDRLASQGRLFNRHYVQVPTCGPSRMCLLTGQNLRSTPDIYHQVLAERLSKRPADPDDKAGPETLIHHFKRNGYYTVGMGKISHNASGRRKGELDLPNSWDKFRGNPNKRWKSGLLHTYADGISRAEHKRPPFERLDLPDEGYPDGELAQTAIEELDRRAKSKQPFFMAVGFFKPHLPFCAPSKYWDMYDRNKIPLSPNPNAPAEVPDVFLHDSNEFFGQYVSPVRGGAGKVLPEDYAREVIHANLASVSYIDAQVGKVLQRLKENGLDENTIVIVWGDHGWHLGDHSIWGKHSVFERSLRSALIVKTPGMKQPGTPTDALVATIDLYPTLCELASLKKPQGLDGQSFASSVNDPNAKGKDAVMSYWRNILSMRTPRYRMAVYDDGTKREAMLFDHDNDPNETKNVMKSDPDVAKQLLEEVRGLNHGFLPGLN